MTIQTASVQHAQRGNMKHRIYPWLKIELILCILSLFIVLGMTIWGAETVISSFILWEQEQSEQNSEDGYITYIYNAFGDKTTSSEDTDESESASSTTDMDSFDFSQVDLEQFADDTGYAGELYAMQSEYPQASEILCRYENAVVTVDGVETTVGELFENAIPERLLQMAADYPQTMDYVLAYPSKIGETFDTDISDEVDLSTVPELLQWDERWGYLEYGDGLLGYTGCGPTCLSMVAIYLTGDTSLTPDVIAEYADENGYYTNGSGSKWTLMTQAALHFGLSSTSVSVSEWNLKKQLDLGRPIICSVGAGDFTTSGHFIVITGYDEDGFTVNDPNSLENSAKTWTYSTLSSQIRAAWSYTLSE